MNPRKFTVGITVGDFNGIGLEVILKTFNEPMMYNYCTPVLYASSQVVNYHKKHLNLDKVNVQLVKSVDELHPKSLNVINCWQEEVIINLGQPSQKAGECALIALDEALKDIFAKKIDALVTAPLNKSTVKLKGKDFTGHTGYITQRCNLSDSLMLLADQNLRIGLVTEHVPLREVPDNLNAKTIYNKLQILNETLQKDYGISGPRIAILGLNPHAGDNATLGTEEKDLIIPVINKAQENHIYAFGPYPADGFFGAGLHKKFDATLAMYHDQGLIAFKAFAFETGVNYTAGLPIIRTSPDHGTAYDIAGKHLANPASFREAVLMAADICYHRKNYLEFTSDPLKKSAVAE